MSIFRHFKLLTIIVSMLTITLAASMKLSAADFSALNASDNSVASSKYKSTQSTRDELQNNKTIIMDQLLETMHNLTSIFEQHEMMSNTHLQDVAVAMNQLSLNLHQLTQQLTSPKIDTELLAKIQNKNEELIQTMEALLLQLNDN